MRFYVDDDMAKAKLVARLTNQGHVPIIPAAVGLRGAKDTEHFLYAVTQSLPILTRNRDDFLSLHQIVIATNGEHPGMIVVCCDNDPTRDMSDRAIATALSKLEAAAVPLVNQFHILNHWR